jgi:hypothetical protein
MKQSGRALIGYYTKAEALATLRGSVGPDEPDPEVTEQWEKMRRAVSARPPVTIVNPIEEPSPEVAVTLAEIQQRPDVQSVFAGLAWRVAVIDLSKPIVSFQKVIRTEEAEDRVKAAQENDWETLVNISLPPGQETQLVGAFDATQNAFTASSVNPNLRIGQFGAWDVPGPNGTTSKVFGFTLSLGASFVQVVHYRDRWMVRDGYHRIYGLLRRGIQKIPCIIVEAADFAQTGAGRPGFFDYELLYSDRPPLLQDFLSDEFSAEVPLPAVIRIVRIRGEEFIAPT